MTSQHGSATRRIAIFQQSALSGNNFRGQLFYLNTATKSMYKHMHALETPTVLQTLKERRF